MHNSTRGYHSKTGDRCFLNVTNVVTTWVILLKNNSEREGTDNPDERPMNNVKHPTILCTSMLKSTVAFCYRFFMHTFTRWYTLTMTPSRMNVIGTYMYEWTARRGWMDFSDATIQVYMYIHMYAYMYMYMPHENYLPQVPRSHI